MKPTLYRHFSEDGTLLYIGASLNFCQRLQAHSTTSAWFDSVVKITLESFESRRELLDAELVAIGEERPLHNYIGQREKTMRQKPSFVAPVAVIPFEQWSTKEQRRYWKLSDKRLKAIAKDRRVPNTLRWAWKLDLNTIYFIQEGRVP